MAKGLLAEWLEKVFGTSYKTTIYGFLAGLVFIVGAIKPDLFTSNGIDVSKFLEGVLIFFGLSSARDNRVNDQAAGVDH